MKLLRALPLVALAACSRTEASAGGAGAPSPRATVRVELESRALASVDPPQVAARFRAANGTDREVAYRGFSEESPTVALEVLEGETWESYMIGWCGTGLLDFTLRPGAEIAFEVVLPADGRTYRARFGEPPVETPPFVAAAAPRPK